MNEHPNVSLGYELLKKEGGKAVDRLVKQGWTREDAQGFRGNRELFRKALNDSIDWQWLVSNKSVGRVGGGDGKGVVVSGFKVRTRRGCLHFRGVVPPAADLASPLRPPVPVKIHHGHITHKNYNVFLDVVRERRATIVSLIRRNTLEAWISFLISTGTPEPRAAAARRARTSRAPPPDNQPPAEQGTTRRTTSTGRTPGTSSRGASARTRRPSCSTRSSSCGWRLATT